MLLAFIKSFQFKIILYIIQGKEKRTECALIDPDPMLTNQIMLAFDNLTIYEI